MSNCSEVEGKNKKVKPQHILSEESESLTSIYLIKE